MKPQTTPINRDFLRDVLGGLASSPRSLPCKYFYDEAGSALFERICELPEYYLTRCGREIMFTHADEMIELLDPSSVLIEFGSGASVKTRSLLARMVPGSVYVPVDISREHLMATAAQLTDDFPAVEIVPIFADFVRPFALPEFIRTSRRRNVYFSGSTLGNFVPKEALAILKNITRLIAPNGGLLIGLDLKKDRSILEPAYDDAQRVTAEFNLNLLARINRELDGTFDLNQFRHIAFYNEQQGRIEMHLESRALQTVTVAGRRFELSAGERICTEYSHKYSFEDFARMARQAGLAVRRIWTDEARMFSVQYAEVG